MTKFNDLLSTTTGKTEELQSLIDSLNPEEEVVVTTEEADKLKQLFKNDSDKVKLLELIADLSRVESNRQKFTDKTFFEDLLTFVNNDKPDLVLQAIRCLCNISAENEDAKSIFCEFEGVKKLLSKAEEIIDKDDAAWDNLVCPACSCIQNLVVDSETVHKAFLNENAMNVLWRYLAKFHSKDTKIASVTLSGLSSLGENDYGLQNLYDSGVLKLVVKLLNVASDETAKLIFQNLLKEVSNQEPGKKFLNQCDSFTEISKIIENRANFKETEIDDVTKEMADFVVVLTSGEESFNVLKKSDPDFLKRFSSWIQSPNKHIQVSAGLALGNYARDEETCNDIVRIGIHENLINVMTENLKDESFSDRAQAYGACLRNLCIPVHNKKILYKAGLHTMAISYIMESDSLAAQFKALAILRLLVQDNIELSSSICLNKALVDKVLELAGTSVVSSVPAESQRLLAAAIKYSSSEVTIKGILKSDTVLDTILALLLSEHTIMQSEGLIALIMIAANMPDCIDLFKEKECVPKVFTLLKKPEVQAQTCFNGLTCFQAVMSIKGGKDLLVSNGVDEVFEILSKHGEDIIKNKASETKELLDSL